MLLKDKIKIKNYLNKYSIKNYELIEDKEYGYVVNVYSDVELQGCSLDSIEIKFNLIDGSFYCGYNKLKSLYGSPEVINGYFCCENNQITSLEYCPKKILKSFDFKFNKLVNLKFFPNECIGVVDLSNNLLIDLNGISDGMNSLILTSNKLNMNSLLCLPKEIKSNYVGLSNNQELGMLQDINNLNDIKKIIKIYQEKANLMKILDVTDKSVVKNLDLLMQNNFDIISNNKSGVIEKINKI